MADGTSLLDQTAANPFQGAMSLLAPVVSGGAITPPPGQAPTPQQQAALTPAWLAFAQRMAQAGAPTLGPAPTFGEALTGAMGAGYGTAVQAGMMPYLQASAQREAIGQNIAIQEAELQLQRQMDIYNLQRTLGGQLSTALGGGGPAAPAVPAATPTPSLGSGTETAATGEQINALPDVQKLPEPTKGAFIAAVINAGMGVNAAGQYARMVMQESGGKQIDPKTGGPLTSSAGAVGVAQVLPSTFDAMKTKYNLSGDINDPETNINAGAFYFQDQNKANAGNLGDAAIAYNAGPAKLADYKAGKAPLPDETQRYLISTGAPAPSSPGVPGVAGATTVNIDGKSVPITLASAPDTGGGFTPSAAGDMVREPTTGMMVPRAVLQSAAMALRMEADPAKGMQAYQNVLNTYVQGVATKPVLTPLTDAELSALPPAVRAGGPLAKRNPDGSLSGIELPAPRAIGLPFSQAESIQKDLTSSPAYNFWVASGPRFDAVVNSLNLGTRAGDEAAVISLAKLFDPNVMASDRSLDESKGYGGVPQQLHELINKPMGESGFTNDVRQQIVQLATAEMTQRDKSVFEAVSRARAFATANNVDPARIGPGITTKGMAITDPEAGYAPEGITFAQPLTASLADPANPDSKLTFTRPPGSMAHPPGYRPPGPTVQGAPAVPATPAAPAAPAAPATPAKPAGGATFTGTADRFTAPVLANMSDSGLQNAYAAMKAHPENYTPHDAQMLAAEKQSRVARQKAGS